VILAYQASWDEPGKADQIPTELRERQELTLELAAEFLAKHKARHLRFHPLGVAQGWSPRSYALAVERLQRIGYTRIALGGMVPLKTLEILASLEAVSLVRKPKTQLHLLGVTRCDSIVRFRDYGVTSFDSTSPLRQAFKDERDNFYTMDGAYTAVRVPQVEGNPGLQKRIKAGQVPQGLARQHERRCLDLLREYDADRVSLEDVVAALRAYEELHDPAHDHSDVYRKVLAARPWASCSCDVCKTLGYHVILFRGAERNRRRGFHNLWVFYRRLKRELGLTIPAQDGTRVAHRRSRGEALTPSTGIS